MSAEGRDAGGAGLLAGIRVIETATWFSGPVIGRILAQLGAEVIKVEPPGGDPIRALGPHRGGLSPLFASANHGKRSVVLDLREDRGREAFGALLGSADALVENWRPGVADRLGLGREGVAERFPSLVRLSVTGFGEGPSRDEPAFDEIIQARTGLAHVQGDGGPPRTVRLSIADLATAMLGAQSVLAALLARERGCGGRHLDLSMLAALSYFAFDEMLPHRVFADAPPEERVPLRPPIAPTSDGHIAIVPGTPAQFRAALEAIGDPEADSVSVEDIAAYNEVLDRLLAATAEADSATWVERFRAADVPVAEVIDPDRHLADPQVAAEGIYEIVEDPEAGRVRRVRYPARYGEEPSASLAPRLGADTEDVLSSL